MYQQSIEESIDYILNYNLHFFHKRRLYQYLHQIALATNKTEAAAVCLNAVSELSPSNAAEHAIPQHVENELLDSINEVGKIMDGGDFLTDDSRSFTHYWDSAATCLNELKKSHGMNNEPGVYLLMLCALATGNVEVLRYALKENYDITSFVRHGSKTTALMEAAVLGRLECVKALLAAGADVHAKAKNGTTALEAAGSGGNPECVKALLAAGADVHAKGKIGGTALYWAAFGGKTECVKALLAAGADVNAKDEEGETALYWAAVLGRLECVKALLAAGADVHAKAKEDGRTALHPAARNEHLECVKALLAAGADVHAKAKDGETALHEAALHGRLECVKTLLAAGADVHAKDKAGRTALHNAALNGCLECVKTLLAAGADWRLTDDSGNTAEDAALSNSKYVDNAKVIALLSALRKKAEADASALRKKAEADAAFWENSYSVINYGIALVFITWVFLSISVKSDIEGSGGDIMLYIIGCLTSLVIKTCLSTKAEDKPRDKGTCIVYGITDFFCAMALCLPAISNKTLGDDISGFAIMSMVVQLAIAIFMYKKAFNEPSAGTISIWNGLIAVTLFYLGGGVMTDSYNFFSNILAALTLGY